MTIRGLLAAIVIPFFLLTCFVVWKYFDLVYYKSLRQMEARYTSDEITVIKKLTSSTSKRYLKIANDWGQWDDSYEFISDRNPRYIKSNLLPSTLKTTDSDIILLINNKADIVYALSSGGYHETLTDVVKGFKQAKTAKDEGTFFIRSGDGHIFFAAYSDITDSNDTMPSKGYFIILISADHFIRSAFSNTGFERIETESVKAGDTCNGNICGSFDKNHKNINIVMDIPTIDKQYLVRFNFTLTRDVFKFVNAMLDKTVLAVMFIFIIASSLMTLIMYFALLRNIRLITKDFDNIENSKDMDVRLPEKGVYELKLLARTANAAMDEIVSLNRKLTKMTNVDGLTGINNRRFFDIMLDREYRDAIRQQSVISLLMLDLDNFKMINDTYGHIAGDECLKTVAKAIANCLKRPSDIAARYGGEEFAVILPGTDKGGAFNVAERIRNAIAAASIACGCECRFSITISIGAHTRIPSPDSTPSDLIAKADQALYQAKTTKNRTVYSD